MSTIYSAFHTGLFGYRNIEETIDVYQSARIILGRISLDLRNFFAYSQDNTKFIGTENEISFFTLVDAFTNNVIGQDYASITYKLEGDRLMRLCRKDKEALNDKSKIEPEEMAANIETIKFSFGYIDSTDNSLKFKDTWAGEDAPDEKKLSPIEVKVKLTLRNKTIKQDFERSVFLPLAKKNE